jgi:hypothetical protein
MSIRKLFSDKKTTSTGSHLQTAHTAVRGANAAPWHGVGNGGGALQHRARSPFLKGKVQRSGGTCCVAAKNRCQGRVNMRYRYVF